MQMSNPILWENGDNLHELSNPVFWENKKIYFSLSSAEIFTQSAER